MQSFVTIIGLVVLTVCYAAVDHDGREVVTFSGPHAAQDGSDDNGAATRATYALIWLYCYVYVAQLIFGWIGVCCNNVIALLMHQITTAVILIMHATLTVYGLATDHVSVLAAMLINFAIEVPNFILSQRLVDGCRETAKGKASWARMFADDGDDTDDDHLMGTSRRATVA